MACGAGKWGDWLVPDRPLGLDLHDTCELHDALYVAPGGRSRWTCDVLWLRAMLSTVRKYHWRKWPHFYAIVLSYFLAVRWRGYTRGWKPCREAWGNLSAGERVRAVYKARSYLRIFGLPGGGLDESYGVRDGWSTLTSQDGM
ncbi:MAG: hypothetical protein SF069_03030 [Phycisphaerae bacterium]|nr:hypothetical protein [Phycisphaerae bacterium]